MVCYYLVLWCLIAELRQKLGLASTIQISKLIMELNPLAKYQYRILTHIVRPWGRTLERMSRKVSCFLRSLGENSFIARPLHSCVSVLFQTLESKVRCSACSLFVSSLAQRPQSAKSQQHKLRRDDVDNEKRERAIEESTSQQRMKEKLVFSQSKAHRLLLHKYPR